MIALLPGSVAESACSTTHSAEQEKCPATDVLSARLRAVGTIGTDVTQTHLVGAMGARDDVAEKRYPVAEAGRCSNLIDGLLEGRSLDERGLRQVASCLRLPIDGPFVVVAVRMPNGGSAPLPQMEAKLRSLDIYSVWGSTSDLQVGIVHCASHQQLNTLIALITRMTVERVGVSAIFNDLRDTPRAMHVARVMLRGPTGSASSVSVFDGSILATAVVYAPETMIKTVDTVLHRFGDLPDWDREMLFETFRAWQDTDASVRGAAEILVCHPNTVRYRLRRIEKRTGRSLSRPRDVVELCLAFEVHRRLM